MRLPSERDDAALIHEMLEAAQFIRKHLETLPGGTFHNNWLVRDAIVTERVVDLELALRAGSRPEPG